MVLDHPCGPGVTTGRLVRRRREGQRRQGDAETEVEGCALKMDGRATGQGMGVSLEGGKGPETDPPPDIPERGQTCPHLDVSPMRHILDF